jgi:hypothetical protein
MKLFTSAFSSARQELEVEPVEGRNGMYRVKNAYEGDYEYFRVPHEVPTIPKTVMPLLSLTDEERSRLKEITVQLVDKDGNTTNTVQGYVRGELMYVALPAEIKKPR